MRKKHERVAILFSLIPKVSEQTWQQDMGSPQTSPPGIQPTAQMCVPGHKAVVGLCTGTVAQGREAGLGHAMHFGRPPALT